MEDPGDNPPPEVNGHGAGDLAEDEGCGSITKVSVRRRSSRHSVTFDVVEHVRTPDENNLSTSDADDDIDGSGINGEENPATQAEERSEVSQSAEHDVTNGNHESLTSARRDSATSQVSRQSQTSPRDVENESVTSNGYQASSSDITNHAETVAANGTATADNCYHAVKPNGKQQQTLVNGIEAPADATKPPRPPVSRQSIISQASKRSAASSGSKRSVRFDTSKSDVTASTLHSRLRGSGRTRALDDATLRRISRKLPVVSDTLPPQSFLNMAALPSRPALSSNTKVAGRLFSKSVMDAEQWTRYTDRTIVSPLGSGPPRRRSRGSLSPIKAPLELVPDKDLGPRLHTFDPRPHSYHHHPRRPRMRPLAQPASTHGRTDVYSFSFKHSDGGSGSGSDNGCDPDSELRSDYYTVKRVTLRSRATACPVDRPRTSMLLLGRQKCLHGRDAFPDIPTPEDMVSQVVGVRGVSAAKL